MAPSDISPAFSRPARAADSLADLADDRHRFLEKHVLLTGEASTLATANGRSCLLDAARLLLRICPNVTIRLPDVCDDLVAVCRNLTDRIAFGTPVTYQTGAGSYAEYDAILSVGTAVSADLPWTVINAQGWLARVSSGTTPLPGDCVQTNPIAALAAASFGVAEVFKRLLKVRSERGGLIDGLCFSLYSYAVDDSDPGPPIPVELRIDLLVVGAGAIGNGLVHLLAALPLRGRVAIVDRQVFGIENLGTCILIGPNDVGAAKAPFAAEILKANMQLDARGFKDEFEEFARRLGQDLFYPSIVLNGLDDIEARRSVQRLWPDLVVDGAIGTFGCQVSRHPWTDDTACLRCLFPPTRGEAAELKQSRVSGLSITRVADADSVVTEHDIESAPADRRIWLQKQLGRQVCSVVAEAIAESVSQEHQREGFTPSVPFVATLSSALVVAEFVKAIAGWPSQLEPRFQFDVLMGPAFGLMLPEARHADCMCVQRRENIERVRQRRAESLASHATGDRQQHCGS
jgi:hypothetical protein